MTDLPKRELGRTGLQVTMLGYGAMELRGAPRGRDVTEAQAETILHGVLDAGINYIDTSIDYGLSEERIGRYIASRRSEYYLASKCGCVVGATPAPRGQQNPHSAVEREHEAIITSAAESGAGIVIRGGAAKGAPSGAGGAGMQWERWQKARLDDLLEGMTPMEFILRFTFTHPDMATNIVGTINPAHLQDNSVALLQGPLPPALCAEVKRRLAAAGSTP